ncbi:aminodeoxychorismate lyase [Metabacillus iocasae]|uniref:aminodeoxychorismate lyase n=1 Tax=Priestia iocasae TaxID=2291674 RepID=A0ABS2QZH9_9BACI|nr:aminodeoxychorismate lyase [Metabacillus iocasae]MBM7704890.1 4-amino-4-deoxychorismate lyase [Metabacillus iocasae]
MYIYINGEIVQQSKAVISPFDHGYMYGLGLFETFRIYDGHPFLLDDHLSRLRKGLEDLQIDWFYSREDIIAIIRELLEKNEIKNAYVRLNVSAGIGEIGLQVENYEQPSTIFYLKSIPSTSPLLMKEGVLLETRRNSPEGKERLKSHHYLNNVIAKREVGSDMSKEGIFLTKEGYLAEGVVSNLFFVKGSIVYTPSIDTGILNGVTRQFILRMLQKQHIKVEEGLFRLDDLLRSDEVFMTNSIQEIFAIKNIGETSFKTGEGTLTYTLQQLYKRGTVSLWSREQL